MVMSGMKAYSGGCHCKRVRFDVTADLSNVISCNCSHCQAKGFLLTFTPTSNFTLKSGEEALTEYRFNKKHIEHVFCEDCGVQPFARAKAPDGTDTIAVNVRCLDDVDIAGLKPVPVDGRTF